MIYLDKKSDGMTVDDAETAMAAADPETVIENARTAAAGLLLGSSPEEIVVTSGGVSEMSSVLFAALSVRPGKTHIITTVGASAVVTQCFRELEAKNGCRVSLIGLNEDGTPDIDSFYAALDAETAFVSLPMANEETGTLFPVTEMTEIARQCSNAVIHVDAGLAVGLTEIKTGQADIVSVPADSFYVPDAIGVIYVRKNSGILVPESHKTVSDVKRLAGFRAAAKQAADLSDIGHIAGLRDRLENGLLSIDAAYINGAGRRLPNISNISFADVNGEALLSRLHDHGVVAETSSACASPGHLPSAIFQAMDVPYARAMGSIRFSLNRRTTEADIDHVIGIMPAIVTELRAISTPA
ncbi:MAG: aminotransferase class V-fold PLP-dependent enzyme [Acidobacteria bacterium]|nr:aminotransferase class V-fold PLP-dependent enzyme [Acidobacteriota bacterium]